MYLTGDKRKRGIDCFTKINASFSFIEKKQKKLTFPSKILTKIYKPLLPHTTSDKEKVKTTIKAPQAILVMSIKSFLLFMPFWGKIYICTYTYYINASIFKPIFFSNNC